mmetsp:Transcript_10933/g.25977  ORF Transcript_10933/g.25977 Transcript_10933/m.25977 type:complete len:250 (+) Transcript_10933:1546-2295(+)
MRANSSLTHPERGLENFSMVFMQSTMIVRYPTGLRGGIGRHRSCPKSVSMRMASYLKGTGRALSRTTVSRRSPSNQWRMSRMYSSTTMRSMAGFPAAEPSTPSGSRQMAPRGRYWEKTALAAVMSSIPSVTHGGDDGSSGLGIACGCPWARRDSNSMCSWGTASTVHPLALSSCTASQSRGRNVAPPLSLLKLRSSWSGPPPRNGTRAVECLLGRSSMYSETVSSSASKSSVAPSASSAPAQGRHTSAE